MSTEESENISHLLIQKPVFVSFPPPPSIEERQYDPLCISQDCCIESKMYLSLGSVYRPKIGFEPKLYI